MKIQTHTHPRARRQAGYSALFITLVLVAASVLMLGATLSRTTTGSRLNDRNCQFLAANGAAEAAVEKALAYIMVDFANSGESKVLTNLSYYQTSLLPTTNENPYWGNFTWSDGQGNNNQIYVARTTVGNNAPYIALEEQYAGLSGYSSTYRILANVTAQNSTYNYNFTNAVQQDLQLAQIPVFQFAIFYNGLMEFSDAATFIVTGPVHCNTNIYVGSPSDLTFNSMVTASGNITSPDNLGMSASSWTGAVNYNGTPSPGYLTGQPTLTLPIGTNSTSGSNVMQILYPPGPGVTYNTPMGQQLYYYKAAMVLMISSTTFTATFKSAPNDGSPATYTTNLSMLTSNFWLTNLTANTTNWTTNWGLNWNWLSTTKTFFDWRENKTIHVTEIDVGKLTNWMNTWFTKSWNTNVNTKFPTNNPFNIIYVADWRYTNDGSANLSAIRLVNGTNLPATGFTLATPNPLYIWGNYNTPNNSNQLSTDTSLSAPSSVACDAITLLSPAWTDAGSWTELSINASSDTVNTAIITGNVPSTGTTATTYSGGANNLTRLLEKWSGQQLWLNTSLVCLYTSAWANTPYQLSGHYFLPPTRHFSFDQNFTISSKMPPGTPNICRLVRASWCNPPPGTVSYAPSPTLDFVAR